MFSKIRRAIRKYKGESLMWDACKNGRFQEFFSIVKQYPETDVNCMDYAQYHNFEMTTLGYACLIGNKDMAGAALSLEGIDVNVRVYPWGSPIDRCLKFSNFDILNMLLKHPEIKIHPHFILDEKFRSCVSEAGCVELVEKGLIDMNPIEEMLVLKGYKETPVKNEVDTLLKLFAESPQKTRKELMKKHGYIDRVSIEMYIYLIMIIDGFFMLKPKANLEMKRFVKICSQLPLELISNICSSKRGIINGNEVNSCLELMRKEKKFFV